MKYKLQMEPETVYERVISSVTHARNYTDDVEWSPEDGTRTEHDFLCRTVEAAIKAGATTINIPDTVGYTVPEEFHALITMLLNRVPNADKAIFSTHCHNDLGMAVANSLAGVRAGARQVECTINGIGERAGNAALEEIVMAIATRGGHVAGVVFHSDRGSVYTSAAYGELCASHGVIQSMGATGVCWDNSVAESWFGTMKRELAHRRRWATRADARRDLIRWIEGWFNARRLHSSNNYNSPIEWENLYYRRGDGLAA